MPKKKKTLKGAAFVKAMAAAKAKKAKVRRGFAIKGAVVSKALYGRTRGYMATKEPRHEVCKPTKPLPAKTNASYNNLCKSYARLGDEYRALGNGAFGAPKGSPIRKQYHAVQKQYKEVGVALFKLGRPTADYGKQHKLSRTEWSKDFDRKRRERTAYYASFKR
jgi:hypothetical protein